MQIALGRGQRRTRGRQLRIGGRDEGGDDVGCRVGAARRLGLSAKAREVRGVDRVVIGTAALTDPALVRTAARAFPGRIVVGVDARDGMVATHGWADVSDVSVTDMAARFADADPDALLASGVDGVVTPFVPEGYTHVYHQYTIRLEGATGTERDAVQAALREEWQVGSGVYYPIPNHRLASLAHYAEGLELPGTEKAARECLSLPVHPSLSEADLERIGQAVAATVKAGA